MNNKLNSALISLLFSLTVCLCGQDVLSTGQFFSAMKSYNQYPSSENALLLYNTLPSCKEKSKSIGFTSEIYGTIYLLSYQALANDRNALRLLFKLEGFSDGDIAELIDQMLGRIIRANPRVFLEELNNHRDCVALMDGLLGNVDLRIEGTGDKATEYEIEMRIKALRNVDIKKLRKIRDECIEELTLLLKKHKL